MRAIVLLSGGLDSATVLALARHQGHRCHAVSFDYGQKQRAELTAATSLAKQWECESHRVLPLPLGALGGSSLTSPQIAIPEHQTSDAIPTTYVPARNTIFLAFALACAEVEQAETIFIGANAVDYSGYPDCRPAYLSAFSQMANLALKSTLEGSTLEIQAPLIHWSKAEIIRAGVELGVDYSATVSCYSADQEGRACGRCDSCWFRAQGFAEAGVDDPTRYQPMR